MIPPNIVRHVKNLPKIMKRTLEFSSNGSWINWVNWINERNRIVSEESSNS